MNELDEYFLYRCRQGMVQRGLAGKSSYEARLKYETDLIVRMGFPGYFLIVWDIINHARSRGIAVGPGRGSVAGALVAYVLKITALDPIRWNLFFERFLNPERISMPDIDMDFEKGRREEVIQYVINKYGEDKVAHIGTFGLLRAKNAIRSVTRTLGLEYAVGDRLAKLLLNPIHGKPQPIKESLDKVEELRDYYNDKNCVESKVIDWAMKVENLISSSGVHPCGVVISNDSLLNTVPLFLGKHDELTTQWEMNNIEQVGLIKFDFLGLNALDKIRKTVRILAEKNHELDIDTIPLDDEVTFAKLRAGEVQGVFQLEDSSGVRDLLVQMRPTSLEDLIALVAIYRPGPLDDPYKSTYLAVKQGQAEPEYLIPELEPILKSTAGWMIYQEQVLQIARDLAGYTLGEADMLRRAIGKKKEKEMATHEVKFKDGWVAKGFSKETADVLWAKICKFADYAFNRSHAAAYALISYQTAFLKANYPKEFMCAILSCENNKDSMIRYISDSKRMGINVLPPHINTSGLDPFSLDADGNIRFGIAPIKNIGEGPVSAIIYERKLHGDYKSLHDFCARVDLSTINVLKVNSLIKAGALDGLGHNRASMLASVEDVWEHKTKMKSFVSKTKTYEKKAAECAQRLKDIEEGKLSKTGKKLQLLSTPEKPEEPVLPPARIVPEMESDELLAAEHELLGYYVSDHPLRRFQSSLAINHVDTIENVKQLEHKCSAAVAAVITAKHEITNKKKQKQAFLVVEDMTGQLEVTVFASVFEKYKDLLNSKSPLKFAGSVEVTEVAKVNYSGDEMEMETESVTKLVAQSIKPLKEVESKSTVIEIEVPISESKKLAEILSSCKGTKYKSIVTLNLRDGNKYRLPAVYLSVDEKELKKKLSVSDIENWYI